MYGSNALNALRGTLRSPRSAGFIGTVDASSVTQVIETGSVLHYAEFDALVGGTGSTRRQAVRYNDSDNYIALIVGCRVGDTFMGGVQRNGGSEAQNAPSALSIGSTVAVGDRIRIESFANGNTHRFSLVRAGAVIYTAGIINGIGSAASSTKVAFLALAGAVYFNVQIGVTP